MIRRRIKVSETGSIVNYRFEGIDTTYSCTHAEWHLKNLIDDMVSKYNVPEHVIDNLIYAANDVYEMNRGIYDE